MLTGTHIRDRRKLKCALALMLASAGWSFCAEPVWLLLPEPSFMDHEIRRPVAGSERTIVTVAREVDGEVVPLTREQKRGIPGTFDKVVGEAEKNASALLATMEPELVRDRRGVIEYAVIQSENHRTASTVFAPDFGEKFAETIGPELFVAIPNRFQVFVFSRQDLAHLRMGEAIISGYLSSNYPVSREIFEWRNGRLRSLGLYR